MFRAILKLTTREKDARIVSRIQSLCSDIDCGLCPSPMASDVAVEELRRFFLGEQQSNSDANAATSVSDTVYQIKCKIKRICFFKKAEYKELSNADEAVSELIEFFLGKDWYVSMPVSFEQCTTEAIYQIEYDYNRFRA